MNSATPDPIDTHLSPVGDDIDGRSFVSSCVKGHDLVGGSRITLSFKGGRVVANAGCNSMIGGYTVDGHVLAVEDVVQTLIGSAAALMEQDTWFSSFLTGRPTIATDGTTLTLSDGVAAVVFTQVAETPPGGTRQASAAPSPYEHLLAGAPAPTTTPSLKIPRLPRISVGRPPVIGEKVLQVLSDGRGIILDERMVAELRSSGSWRKGGNGSLVIPDSMVALGGALAGLVLPGGAREHESGGNGRREEGNSPDEQTVRGMGRRGFLKRVGLLAAGGYLAGQKEARGLLMDPSTTPLEEYHHLGIECAAREVGRPLFFRGVNTYEGEVSYGTCFAWNSEYAITAAHVARVFDPSAPGTYILTGTDLLTSVGERIRVSEVNIFPGYKKDDYSVPDIAILKFTEPVPRFKQVKIAKYIPNETYIPASYGAPAIAGQGYLPDSEYFKVRAFYAREEALLLSTIPRGIYGAFDFEIGRFGPGNAKYTGGASGGPVYPTTAIGSNNEVMGVNVAETGGNRLIGSSIFARLDYPDTRAWIGENTKPSSISSPLAEPQLNFSVEGQEFCLRIPWSEQSTDTGTWKVQESSDLKTWGEELLDFTQTGSQGILRRPLGTQGFYRLVWVGN